METVKLILLSQNQDVTEKCQSICNYLSLPLVHEKNFPMFVYDLYLEDFSVAVMVCDSENEESMTMASFVLKIRPGVPLIVLLDKMNESLEKSLYEKGAFYVGQQNISQLLLHELIVSSIKTYLIR